MQKGFSAIFLKWRSPRMNSNTFGSFCSLNTNSPKFLPWEVHRDNRRHPHRHIQIRKRHRKDGEVAGENQSCWCTRKGTFQMHQLSLSSWACLQRWLTKNRHLMLKAGQKRRSLTPNWKEDSFAIMNIRPTSEHWALKGRRSPKLELFASSATYRARICAS